MDQLRLMGLTHAASFELGDGLLAVGRNPTNDFRVSDATVSSFHCELIVRQNSVLVRDLNSTNGTFIDNEPVQESFLKPGQILRIGNCEFRLEAPPPPEAVPIRIPEIRVLPEPVERRLSDGSLACANHPGTVAAVRCTQCGQAFCDDCVHPLRLKGRETRLYCPNCSALCEPLGAAAPGPAKGKPTFLGRLTQTIRIRFK